MALVLLSRVAQPVHQWRGCWLHFLVTRLIAWEGGLLEPSLEDWRSAICSAPDLQQLGPRLLWGFSRGYVFEGLNLLGDFAKPFATSVASKLSPGVFPLPCDFSAMGSWKWPQGDFEHLQCVESWLLLVAAALNSLHGINLPFQNGEEGTR